MFRNSYFEFVAAGTKSPMKTYLMYIFQVPTLTNRRLYLSLCTFFNIIYLWPALGKGTTWAKNSKMSLWYHAKAT